MAAGLASLGVETFGIHGVDAQGYEDLLIEALKCHPHIVIDDGGDLIDLLGGKCGEYADCLLGGCEETTTGILRLKAREKAGLLPCPMMAVNDAGAAGMGANVIVTEIDPFKALDATMNGFRVMPMDQAAPLGDIFVTVTGCKDVIVPRHFAAMKDNVLLANAGHFDCEVAVAALREMAVKAETRRENIVGYTLPNGQTLNVLAEGRLVNLAAGNGHPAEIMDMSFAVQALAAEWLTKQTGLEKKVYPVPEEIDDQIGRAKLAALGLEIDALTPEQEAYLNSWSV